MNAQPLTVLVCALGGEGGGVLAEWLVAVARRAGHAAQSSSIPGVAQRTGATTYYLEFARQPRQAGATRDPVFALAPVPGQLDLLVGSELLETARQVGNGLSTRERTVLVASTARTLTTLERMHGGDGRVDAEALTALLRAHSRTLHLLDMAALTREAGTVVSSVMLGCIAGSGVLPFAREHFEAVVQGAGGASAAASLRGFALGWLHVSGMAGTGNTASMAGTPPTTVATPPRELTLDEVTALGRTRVVEYQDEAYGRLYDERLARVRTAERTAGATTLAATHETARWLALWMAFDDIVQVARLKARAARAARVRAEARAEPGDLVKVFDHFKPGVPEFAALLPPRWAERLQRWDRARQQQGLAPWALPIQLGTHTVHGMLALRLLGGLRGWRRRGQRFAQEQALIERWLDAVVHGLAGSAPLGLEVAACGRLIKGYASTNERGKERLLHVIEHVLPLPGTPADRARAVADLRRAALAQDTDRGFAQVLQAHGAPVLAPREQPIRWVRRGSQARR